MRVPRSLTGVLLLMCACLGCPQSATAGVITITFDEAGLAHGTIINTQFQSSLGITISATNVGGGPNLAVAFDSTAISTRDPDLEDPWSGGNLAPDTDLGNLLIIQENNYGTGDGTANLPDDEGSRPAGSLFFDFETPITSIGFDLVDIEGPTEFGRNSGYVATFFMGPTELARVGFGAFIDSSSPFYDSTVKYGNNTANRIKPITADDLEISQFDRVEFNMGGSGAVDNVSFTPVPEPASLTLLGIGIAGLFGYGRRRKS